MTSRSDNPGLDRVTYELRSSGVSHQEFNALRSGIHSRGYLPHVKREGVDYFVTFRLADSFPKTVLMRYEAERAERLRRLVSHQAPGQPTDTEGTINVDFRRKVERYLDKGAGECHLRRPEIASLVGNAMRYFDGQRYILREWVVMPNHVHALLRPTANSLLGGDSKDMETVHIFARQTNAGPAAGPVLAAGAV